MSCNNYTTSRFPVSVGFDASGNAASLVETKEIVLTKITAYQDPESDETYDLIIDPGDIEAKVIIKNDVVIEGAVTANAGVTITGASAISGLTDTNITTPIANGELLVWSSTDWINATLTEAGVVGTGTLASYATNASLANYATTNSLSAYATSAWVSTNFLGTGTVGSTVQQYGAALDAIRSLPTTADTIPRFVGGAALNTTLTPFARTDLLAATGAGVVQANLGLRPGVEVQIQNDSLNDISNIDRGFINTNDVIAWDGANWIAQAAPGGGGPIALNSISDVSSDGAANNSFLVYNGTNWIDETPAEARDSLGATTVGNSLFTLTNPGEVTFLRVNANNSVSTRTDSEMRSDLGLTIGSNVQAYDAALQSIADSNPGSATLIYFSGTNAAAKTPLTGFARTILDDDSGSAVRTTLSLRPGIDIQAFDQSLQDIAGICDGSGVSAYGRLLYTVNDDNNALPDISILPVPVGNEGQVLRLGDVFGYKIPLWTNLALTELADVNVGGGAGQGGTLTPGRILYVNTSNNLTELTNPGSTSFLRHDGTTPQWRNSTNTLNDIGAQPLDNTLTTIAALNPGSNSLIYFTDTNTAATASLAPFARTTLSSTTDATFRTNLGLGSVATESVVPVNKGGTNSTTAAGARASIFSGLGISKGDLITYDGSDYTKIAAPAADGNYLLKVVNSGGEFTFSWAPESNYSN